MNKDRIARCRTCGKVDWSDADGFCFDDSPTTEILYSTFQIDATKRPETDEPEAA